MTMKEPSGEMRCKMSGKFHQMKLSSPTIRRIIYTFTFLEPQDHGARESLAANWVKKLEGCKTEKEVQKMLDEMGL